ncbi:MAG: glycosyltransferase [Clostridiales bacterium]|nr:glycosyltransferase [Clostridiales bacterium]
MRVLILTCNTGGGHNAVAAALAESFRRLGVSSDTEDGLSFISQKASRFVSKWHTRFYRRYPKLYKAGYMSAENDAESNDRDNPVYRYMARGARRLDRAIQDGGYDAVVCVHVIPAMMMTELRRQHETGPVFCFVATDYTCSPTVGGCTPDICVIPHEELAEEFVSCGIARETLLAAGIPVRAVFRERGDRAAARSELALPPEGRHIVLMSGSIGCGPMADIAAELEKRMERGDFASVLCGSNRQMLYALRRRGFRRVEAVGFTNRVHRYMDSADVLVSKPGGISITEAGTRGTPLLLADMVGGCETRNQEFFHARGWAETCQPEDMADAALALLDRPERRQALVAQQHRDFDGLAADRVAQAVYDRCRGGEAAKA